MDPILFKGAFVGWLLRSEDRIPGFFPISPKWRFVLFGFTTIAYAKHPEGLVENGKRNAHARMAALRERRAATAAAPEVEEAVA